MGIWGPDPFENDTALDFLDYLGSVDFPEQKVRDVLEAIVNEDNGLPAPAVELGIAAAGRVAAALEPELCPFIEEHKKSFITTNELSRLAHTVIKYAMQPWNKRTGYNGLYAFWESQGETEAYLQALNPYVSALCLNHEDLPGAIRPSDPTKVDDQFPPQEVEYESIREQIYALAGQCQMGDTRPFDPSSAKKEGSVLAAKHRRFMLGAIVYTSTRVIEDLYDDLDTLVSRNITLADLKQDDFKQLSILPWRFAASYDKKFVRRLLGLTFIYSEKVLRFEPVKPSCIAEQIVARIFRNEIHELLEEHSGFDEPETKEMTSCIEKILGVDNEPFDMGNLYFSSSLRVLAKLTPLVSRAWLMGDSPPRSIDPHKWFLPFDKNIHINPFLKAPASNKTAIRNKVE